MGDMNGVTIMQDFFMIFIFPVIVIGILVFIFVFSAHKLKHVFPSYFKIVEYISGNKLLFYVIAALIWILVLKLEDIFLEDHISDHAIASIKGECTEPLYKIKGNRNKKGEWIYHLPIQQYYHVTYAEECFSDEYDAQQAGYRKSKR